MHWRPADRFEARCAMWFLRAREEEKTFFEKQESRRGAVRQGGKASRACCSCLLLGADAGGEQLVARQIAQLELAALVAGGADPADRSDLAEFRRRPVTTRGAKARL